jgi:hypothetical protein
MTAMEGLGIHHFGGSQLRSVQLFTRNLASRKIYILITRETSNIRGGDRDIK